MAARLVGEENDNISQQVIAKLATEGGLLRVSELIEFSKRPDAGDSSVIFEQIHLPFLHVIGGKRVMDSRASANELGIIYNSIYGMGGRDGVTLFSFFAKAVREKLETDDGAGDFQELYPWAVAILRVLAKLLASCQSASLHEEFKEVVDAVDFFMTLVDSDFKGSLMEQDARQDMITICRYLNYGTSLTNFGIEKKSTARAKAFELEIDGPGSLSNEGPRHDNDHEDIQEIKILPTMTELLSQRAEYLPTKEGSSWHIAGINGLVDRQFRLLREDTVGQLRDCVRTVMERLNSGGSHAVGLPRQALRFHTYEHVEFYDLSYDKKKRLHVTASFNQPRELHSKNAAQRKKWWDESRQLQVDSLVCAVDSAGHSLFFSVCERNGKSEAEEDLPQDTVLPRMGPQGRAGLDLFSDEHEATITLRLIDLKNQDFTPILGRVIDSRSHQQTLVEFPGVILPSFKPTLEALQRMNRENNIPFAGLLAPQMSTPDEEKEVQLPRYCQQPRFAFDLNCILKGADPLLLRDATTFDLEKLMKRSTLDQAQAEALVQALLRNLALIQGPPGTGKSYVAVQMVKVLLHHRQRAQMGPIIVV